MDYAPESINETLFYSFEQTFLRQRVFLASSDSDPIHGRKEQKILSKKDVNSAVSALGCYSCQNDEVNASYKTEVKCEHGCSRVLTNPTVVGALRYALHLRFVCPHSKRSTISRRSDPSLASEINNSDADENRRFYLYDDLRVVFPQRHSDADEGKVRRVLYF